MNKWKKFGFFKYNLCASQSFLLSVCEDISHEVFCKDENLNLIDENFRKRKERIQFVLRRWNVLKMFLKLNAKESRKCASKKRKKKKKKEKEKRRKKKAWNYFRNIPLSSVSRFYLSSSVHNIFLWMFKYLNVKMYNCLNVWLLKYSNVKMYNC